MKIKKITSYRDHASVKTSVKDFMYTLKFAEFSLKYMKAHPIPRLDKFRAALLKSLSSKAPCAYSAEAVTGLVSEYPMLAKDPELGRALVVKILALLDLDCAPLPTVAISVDAKSYLRGYLFIFYYWAKAIAAVMPKKKAIEYFQRIIDGQTRSRSLPKMGKVSEWVFTLRKAQGAFKHAFICTEFIMDEGRSGCRVDKCKWAEVLKELADPDFAYAVACHYDFEAARMRNPSFKLTRKQTLTEGYPYQGDWGRCFQTS